MDKINFTALAEALLSLAETLVPQWLPGGRRNGHEWVCGSLAGGEGKSCSVNLHNGRWADFAAGEQGGDLISLYAAIHQLDMGKAAAAVARENGLESVAGVQLAGGRHTPPPRPPAPPPVPKPAPEREQWTTLVPVPSHAPMPTFWHAHRAAADIVATWRYERDGHLLGYVVRFRTSDGGKDTLPHTYCRGSRDGACKWHWKTWDEPRPLYLPARVTPAEGLTVVIVEGEKCADALHALLAEHCPGVYAVISWPGGGKAWRKADWSMLQGRTVLLWPDCDAKRELLTKAERSQAAGDPVAQAVLEQAKPLLPAAEQPGIKAMQGIGEHLAGQGCTVTMLAVPEPGEVPDGWDCADAIQVDGWPAAKVLAFFGQAQPLRLAGKGTAAAAPPDEPPNGKKIDGPGEPGGGDSDEFEQYLCWLQEELEAERYELVPNRSLMIKALRTAPALKGCLAFDELRGAPCTRVPWPFRETAGPLQEADDLRVCDWLNATYKLRPASRQAISEAFDTVADERRFHPVRDYLEAQTWDGVPRLEKWLIHVLGLDPENLAPRFERYLQLVGKYQLLGLVARVMDPGCKFDYSLVLEGIPGIGKSTLVKVLVGKEFFSDTHFDIGDGTRGMEQLEGLWAYELSEMTAFRRADSEQVKQFFSSTVDRFRGAYAKYVQPHPRQCVIFCTTNKRQYLYDLTGNRRFWPVWIAQRIRVTWLEKWRGQLFAEALAAYRAGERYWPTPEEEDQFFLPEQKKRLVETSVMSRLYELLTREGAAATEGKATAELNENTTFVTLQQLVGALGADVAKSSTMLESQIRGWLDANGWEPHRETTKPRKRGYRAPADWPKCAMQEDESDPAPAPGRNQDGGTPAQAPAPDEDDDDSRPF